jgi:hypothetical protein
MPLLAAAFVIAALTTWLAAWLGADGLDTMFIIVFLIAVLCGLPYQLVRSFAHGIVDHQQDRIDEREEELLEMRAQAEARVHRARLKHPAAHIHFMDARTINVDGRSISHYGEEPEEGLHGSEKGRRGKAAAQERKVIGESSECGAGTPARDAGQGRG